MAFGLRLYTGRYIICTWSILRFDEVSAAVLPVKGRVCGESCTVGECTFELLMSNNLRLSDEFVRVKNSRGAWAGDDCRCGDCNGSCSSIFKYLMPFELCFI